MLLDSSLGLKVLNLELHLKYTYIKYNFYVVGKKKYYTFVIEKYCNAHATIIKLIISRIST